MAENRHLNHTNWKDIAELIAIVAIVASLIFVGLQLKQGQQIALATQYQARTQSVQGLIETQMEIGQVTNAPGWRDAISEGILSSDINETHWLWLAFDNHYFQYQSGFLEESAWEAQLRNIRDLYSDCRMRLVYDWRKNGLRSEFVELVDSIEDPCDGAD